MNGSILGEGYRAVPDGSLAIVTSSDRIHFNTGQYDPHTVNGAELISHEFMHIMQAQDLGGLYIPKILIQYGIYGYWDAPMEVNARGFATEVMGK